MANKTFAYISSWTHGEGVPGIGAYRFDPESGALEFLGMENTDADFNVTYHDKKRNILYACNETMALPKMAGGGGRIFVFKINEETGRLTQIDCKPTWCPSPSYVGLDDTGAYMIVSNHASRAVATKIRKDAFGKYYLELVPDDAVVELFAVNPDGTIGELLDVVYHTGNGTEKRQAGPHPHCVVMSPNGKFFAVCDKGNDTVRFYEIDREKNQLKLAAMPTQCEPKTLPRYAAFHPEKPFFYHNNEYSTEFYSYRYDENGNMERIGAVEVLTPSLKERCVEVVEQQGLAIHSNGKYIYDVLRGPNVVVVLEVDDATGAAYVIQHVPVDGAWPRGCNLSPDGKFLSVCCVKSGKIISYAVREDGTLTAADQTAEQNCAAYITFCEM